MTKQHYEELAAGLRRMIKSVPFSQMRDYERKNWINGFCSALAPLMATLRMDNFKFQRERFLEAVLDGIENQELHDALFR
jgi:hypothetical protein